MPVKLSGCSSLIQSEGQSGRAVATLLFAPGVTGARLRLEGAGFTLAWIPDPENRSTKGPPLALCRYQKLRVYVCPAVNGAGTLCQIELPWELPALVDSRCSAPFPECLMDVLSAEFARFAETVHGPGKPDSKSPSGSKFAPEPGALPATSWISSI